MRYINSSPVRFVFWGGINTLITYGIYLLCLLIVPYQIAYTISYLSGIVISYLLNTIFVFKQKINWKSAVQYPIVYVVQYVVGIFLITGLVEFLKIEPSIAAIVNVIIMLPITFVLTRFIILKRKPLEKQA